MLKDLKYKFHLVSSTGTFSRQVFPSNSNAFNIQYNRKIENGLYYYEKTLNLNEVNLINKADEGIDDYNFMRQIEAGEVPEIGKFDKFYFTITNLDGDEVARYVCYSFLADVNIDRCTYLLKLESENIYLQFKRLVKEEVDYIEVESEKIYSYNSSHYSCWYIDIPFNYTPYNLPTDPLDPFAIPVAQLWYADISFLWYSAPIEGGLKRRWFYLWEWIILPIQYSPQGANWTLLEEAVATKSYVRSYLETLSQINPLTDIYNGDYTTEVDENGVTTYTGRPASDYFLIMPSNVGQNFNTSVQQIIVGAAQFYWYKIRTTSGALPATDGNGSAVLAGIFTLLPYKNGRRFVSIFQYILDQLNTGLTLQSSFFNAGGGNYVTGEATKTNNIFLFSGYALNQLNAVATTNKVNLTIEKMLQIASIMFDCHAAIIGDKLRIEHRQFWEQGLTQNNTGLTFIETANYLRPNNGQRFDYKKQEYQYGADFFYNQKKLTIDSLIEKETVDVSINSMPPAKLIFNIDVDRDIELSTNFTFIAFNREGRSDENIAIVCVQTLTNLGGTLYDNVINFDPSAPRVSSRRVINGHFYPANLLANYHKRNSPKTIAKIGRSIGLFPFNLDETVGEIDTILSYSKRQTVAIPYCDVIDESRLYEYFETELGKGILESASLNIKTGMLTLNILHQ